MSRSFDILLGESDDAGAGFRQKRLGDEIEHRVIIERVIFDFSFQPNKRAKRFVQAQISVVFADEQNKMPEYDPEVKEMSFVPSSRGGYFLLLKETEESKKKAGSKKEEEAKVPK
ncbi:hypothetical protein B7494_g6396 [Chlorociboria aeruginascens]|nr:hypothetical protein B7494_g6396 [Chlorociboria aeruginascens]